MRPKLTKSPDERIEIAIVDYPGAWRAAIYGLTDMFELAGGYAAELLGAEARGLRVTHWQRSADGAVAKVFDSHPDLPAGRPQVVVIPPGLGAVLPSGERMGMFPDWIRTQHGAGAVIASACGGASLLAETGLLAGRTATTHWLHGETIARRHPDVRINTDKMILDDGDIITAGGMMAWTDLGLRIIDRLLGAQVMLAAARFMLIDPGAREQSFYSKFAPSLDHGDVAILGVQHWLHGANLKDVTLQDMAERAGLGDRTFLRRFQKATGLNPTEYTQRMRMAKARDLLEQSSLAVEQVAWQSGYEDPNAFRKIFRKIVGLSPGQYRARFSIIPGVRDEVEETA